MNYTVIDSKVYPTFTSEGKLAVAYVRKVKKDTGAASSFATSLSSPTASSDMYNIMTMHDEDGSLVIMHGSDVVSKGTMSDEAVNAAIKTVTEGMSETNTEKVRLSLASSVGVMKDQEFIATNDVPVSDENKQMFEEAFKSISAELDKLREGSTGTASKSKLEHYSFRKHLLIQGEKGGGKTYMVDKLIKERGYNTEFIGGHEAIEAIDLLGYYIKTDGGDLVWKDGGLTAAFRRAAKGEQVVLFIDEMLRIPKRELNILVAALTPDSDGQFRLRTSRAQNVEVIDGNAIAQEETLAVPSNMIWAIGTTNAGAGYAVDTIDEALADRFRTIIKQVTEKEIKAILEGYVKEHPDMHKSIVGKLMKFYKNFHDMKKAGELTKVLNVRHLTEVIILADNTAMVQDMLMDLVPTLCTQDVHGYPTEAQAAVVETLIEKM